MTIHNRFEPVLTLSTRKWGKPEDELERILAEERERKQTCLGELWAFEGGQAMRGDVESYNQLWSDDELALCNLQRELEFWLWKKITIK